MIRRQPRSTRPYTLFPYTTLFRSRGTAVAPWDREGFKVPGGEPRGAAGYPTFGADAFVEAVRAAPQQSSTDNMLKALYEGSKVPMDPALLIESSYFFDTALSPSALEKVEAFLTRGNQGERGNG